MCFNTGVLRSLLATASNFTPAMLEDRKWIMVRHAHNTRNAHSNISRYGDEIRRRQYILRREAKEGDPLLCIWSDEYQNVCNSDDRAFVEAAAATAEV